MNKTTVKGLAALRKAVRATPAYSLFSPHNWGFAFADGTWHNVPATACFGSVSSTKMNRREPIAFYSWCNPFYKDEKLTSGSKEIEKKKIGRFNKWSSPTREEALIFTDFLINESSYAEAFITKNPTYALNRGVVLDMKYPAQYVIGAAIWNRTVNEIPVLCHVWNQLKDTVNPNFALYLTHHWMPDHSYGREGQYTFMPSQGGGHNPLYVSSREYEGMSPKAIRNMVNGVHPENHKSMRYSRSYYGVTKYWGPQGRFDIETEGLLLTGKVKGEWGIEAHSWADVDIMRELAVRWELQLNQGA